MPFRYVPILKTKAGEVEALANLSPMARSRIFPLVRATTQIPATFQPSVLSMLTGLSIALDGEHNFSASGSFAAFASLFRGLGTHGMSVIPAISFNSVPAYLTASRRLVGVYAPGAVLQIALVDLPQAQAWCTQQLQIPPSDIDLVITVGDVSSYDPSTMARYVRGCLTGSLNATSPWRSISLNSYSAARDHGGYARGVIAHEVGWAWARSQALGWI